MTYALNFSFRKRFKLSAAHTVYGLSGTLTNFALSILIVRLFSLTLWGSLTQLLLTLMLFSLLTSWGNKEYLIREFSGPAQPVRLWQTAVISRLGVFFVVVPVIFLFPIVGNQSLLFSLWLFVSLLYRSFDSLIVFHRRFKEALAIELVGFGQLILCLFVWQSEITLSLLVVLFLLNVLLKTFLCLFLFRKPYFQSFQGKFDLGYLLDSLPYCLPPLIGYLQAKGDSFAVALQLSSMELGQYYLLISLISYCHAIPLLAITPFLQNMYRMNDESLAKMRRTFFLAGLAWSALCIVGIRFVMVYLYHISFANVLYAIAWFALPPYFIYFLLSQQLIRDKRPYSIVLLNLVAAGLNFLSSMILIARFGMRGGLIACAAMQWFLLAGFLFIHARQRPRAVTS